MQSTLVRPPQDTFETLTTRELAHFDTPSTPKLLPLVDLVGIAALSAVIAIHTSELSGKIEETAYLGFGYIAMIMASVLSIVLLAQRDMRGWILGGLTAAATMIGFVLTRTTGLPGATGDIGNWGETIAVWSLIAEGIVVLLCVIAVSKARRRRLGYNVL
jgi:hypothetical protein